MKQYFVKLILIAFLCVAASSKYENKTFNDWTWIVAHNANVNWDDSGVIIELSNQKYGIDKLLRYGVRGFMFDIDVKKCNELEKAFQLCKCEGVCLCHGPCDASIFKDGFNIKPFTYALKKLVTFLKRNPEEFITLFLENYVSDIDQFRSTLESVDGLTDLMFDPHDIIWNVPRNGWPKIVDMIKANKRLLIVDDEKRAFSADHIKGIIRSRDFFLQNHYDWTLDKYEWPVLRRSNSTMVNKTQTIIMPRCFSLHKINGKPMWNIGNPLNLNIKEHEGQVINGKKLFLFNHYYGIQIASLQLDPLTLSLVNNKEYILKRVNEKCAPGTNNIKPTHIALDFIDKTDTRNILSVFNTKK